MRGVPHPTNSHRTKKPSTFYLGDHSNSGSSTKHTAGRRRRRRNGEQRNRQITAEFNHSLAQRHTAYLARRETPDA